MMIKILFYSKVLYPKIGGYVSSSSNLLKALTRVGEITLLLNDSAVSNKEIFANKKMFDVVNVINLTDINLCELQNFDAIFFNGTHENDYLHREFLSLKIPLITYEHQVPETIELRKEFHDRIASAHLVLVPSNFLRDQIYEMFGIKANVINLPIDTQLFQRRNRISLNLNSILNGNYVLLTVCMIKPVRNIEALFYVLRGVLKKIKNVVLVIVGDTPHYISGEYMDYIRLKAKQLDVYDHVIFLGAIEQPDQLANIYSLADLYVDTSNSETFGQAKAEALACENFVVTLDVGNSKYLINNQYRSYLSKDYDSMIHTIVDLLKNGNLRARLGEESRNYIVKQYSTDVTSRRLKELLFHAL